ncbi:hypothetical protein GJQ63_24220 [Escherichia coli]|nr:hypothetical protein [Escherichia coli]
MLNFIVQSGGRWAGLLCCQHLCNGFVVGCPFHLAGDHRPLRLHSHCQRTACGRSLWPAWSFTHVLSLGYVSAAGPV